MALAPESHWEYQVTIDAPSDTRWTITEASQGFAELLGYVPGDIPGLALARVMAPTERALVSELYERVIEGGWEGRMRLCTSDGRDVWVEVAAEIHVDPDGKRTLSARLHDIAEQVRLEAALQEREARLQSLNERLAIVMWSFDTSLHITWMWGSGLKELGIEENELVGRTAQEYLGTDDPDFPPLAAAFRALEGERVEYEVVWQNRSYRSSVEPMLAPDGQIVGVIGTAIDVTDSPGLFQETIELGKNVGGPRLRAPSGGTDEVLRVGSLTIDVDSHECTKDGRTIELTPTEFRLLTELARRPGRVLSREVLLQRVWGHGFLGGGSLITMAVKRLRTKIEADPGHPALIETVRGIGYRLRPVGPE
jgi:PAS domain S-box-containing protein